MKLKDVMNLPGTDSIPYECNLKGWAASAYVALRTARDALAIQHYTPQVQRAWQAAYDVLRAAEEEL